MLYWDKMFALKGFTRFPIFYSSNGRNILGARPKEEENFVKYVYRLPDNKLVAIKSISNIKLVRRIIVDRIALNFELKVIELYPHYIYVYDDLTPDTTFNNYIVRGFTVKGPRLRVFIPLIPLASLEKEEINAFKLLVHRKKKLRELDMNTFNYLLDNLGVKIIGRKPCNGNIALAIYDPFLDTIYNVLVDKDLKVLDTNICFETDVSYYLPEFIVFIRRSGGIYVYPEDRYDWTISV